MGQGIDLGRADAPELAAVLDDFKDQLLILLVQKLVDQNGDLLVSVAEVDATGGLVLDFSIDPALKNFRFHLHKKS